jgi:phosphoribosylglycinamide formyltransferase-1
MKPIRLGILGSTRGTDMLALIAAIGQQELNATIEIVISNKQEAIILERSRIAEIPAEYIAPLNLTRAAYDNLVSEKLAAMDVELVVLIGYMRILSAEFVSAWKNKIINVHPSLLPDFAGGMGNAVHQAVLDAGKSETGCTVHYVTEEVDAGPIVVQKCCAVVPGDTVDSLKNKVQALEGAALIEAINQIAMRIA